jgi:predicted RNA methylase
MADKYGGAIVGVKRSSGDCVADGASAAQASDVSSTLMTADGAALVARLDGDGGVCWERHADSAAAQASVVVQSQMASMLRDDARNKAYEAAITRAVADETAAEGRAPTVLDIGTGCGLLSLLAVRAGAARVYGVEQWPTMAALASAVCGCNEGGERVSLLTGHSNDVTVGGVGTGPTLPARADLLVSEILDSALLGEGILSALRDAYARLMRAGSRPTACVPTRARIWAQLVHSQVAGVWQASDDVRLRGSASWARVPGCEALHPTIPVHARQLQAAGDLTELTAPVCVLDVDFSPGSALFRPDAEGGGLIVEKQHALPSLPAALSSTGPGPNAVLWWWDAILAEADERGPEVSYTTGPKGDGAWVDHWTACLTPLPKPVGRQAGGSGYTLVACHNDTRVWFYASSGDAAVWPSKRSHKLALKRGDGGDAALAARLARPALYAEPQPCICGLHESMAVDRRWTLADEGRTAAFATAIDGALRAVGRRCAVEAEDLAEAGREMGLEAATERQSAALLDLGDGGLCALLAASSPALSRDLGVTVFVPHAVARYSAGSAQIEAQAAVEGADSIDEEPPSDPSRVHLRALFGAIAASTGAQLVLVPAPPAACTPLLLGSAAANATAEEEEEEEGGAEAVEAMILDIVVGEPHYSTIGSALWAAAAWWRRAAALRGAGSLHPSALLSPSRATIVAQAVVLRHLGDVWAPLGAPVLGFDHSALDAVQARYVDAAFNLPMWQYEWTPTGAPISLLAIDLWSPPPPAGKRSVTCCGEAVIAAPGANAVLFWVDYDLTPRSAAGGEAAKGSIISTGPADGRGPSPTRQTVKFLVCPVSESVRVRAFMGDSGAFEGEAR